MAIPMGFVQWEGVGEKIKVSLELARVHLENAFF